MSHPIFLRVDVGDQSEPILGTVTSGQHKGKTLLLRVEHTVAVSEAATTQPGTAPTTHTPLVVSKLLDQYSPLLNRALGDGEPLPRVVIEYCAPDATGDEQVRFTTTLHDAMVQEIRTWVPTLDPEEPQPPYTIGYAEDVSFVYRRIGWRDEHSGIEWELQGMLA